MDDSGSGRKTYVYLAYFELHDVEWQLKRKFSVWPGGDVLQVTVGRGVFHVPDMAFEQKIVLRPRKSTLFLGRAGITRRLSTKKLHAGVAIFADDDPVTGLQVASRKADLIASLVGLALQQTTPLKKVAGYMSEHPRPVSRARRSLIFGYQNRVAGPAKFGSSEAEAFAKALSAWEFDGERATALRWLEVSKGLKESGDRLVALWIALEAVAGEGTERRKVWLQQAIFYSCRSGAAVGSQHRRLDAEFLRKKRNDVVHRGVRDVNPKLDGSNRMVDYTIPLELALSEGLRMEYKLPPTGEFHAAVCANSWADSDVTPSP